jgi:hypothetical protein
MRNRGEGVKRPRWPTASLRRDGKLDSVLSMDCKQDTNLKRCNCTYNPCSRKGTCCDCLQYHLRMRELPACVFPAAAERTFDRSFDHFARLVTSGKV